jgi:hypothetical protein
MDGVEVGIDSVDARGDVGNVRLGGSGNGNPANMHAWSNCSRRRS